MISSRDRSRERSRDHSRTAQGGTGWLLQIKQMNLSSERQTFAVCEQRGMLSDQIVMSS